MDAAALVRRARLAAGLTQTELGRRAGITQSVVSAYESGRREPALSTLARLIEATGARLAVSVEPRSDRELPDTDRGRMLRRRRVTVRRIAAAHGVSNVRVFGSTARGDDTAGSDIDLLIHLDRPVGLIGLARLEHELRDALGTPIDLVPDDGLKPAIRAAAERDAIPL